MYRNMRLVSALSRESSCVWLQEEAARVAAPLRSRAGVMSHANFTLM
jgi:hypothetical protein